MAADEKNKSQNPGSHPQGPKPTAQATETRPMPSVSRHDGLDYADVLAVLSRLRLAQIKKK